jgi:hypothetical protein
MAASWGGPRLGSGAASAPTVASTAGPATAADAGCGGDEAAGSMAAGGSGGGGSAHAHTSSV